MEKIKIEIEIQDNGQTNMQRMYGEIQGMLKSIAVCKFEIVGQDKKMVYEKGDMDSESIKSTHPGGEI